MTGADKAYGLIVTPNGRPAVLEALENNWYEASRWSPNRSWVWFPVQDARYDLDRFTRYELSKHARYLYKNSPLIRGIIERYVSLVVGVGFHPVFKSDSKPDWARKAQCTWVKKRRNVNLGYRASFSQYTRAICRVRGLDGEGFSIKTFSEMFMENRVQGVEGDRCIGIAENQVSAESERNPTSVDGVNLNAQGEPVSYSFRGVKTPYSALDVVHHYTPNRPGQYRGETMLAAAINTARDVDDILALEKNAVKDASSKTDVIETPSGEINPETFRSLRYSSQFPTIFNLPTDNRAKNDYYNIKFGAAPIVLQTGDKYNPYVPQRPGSAWEGFMDFLSGTICLSTNFPASVILPIQLGGTDIRRDLDIAQRVVDPLQLDIAAELEDLVLYLMEGELYDGPLADGQPDDWYLAWHFPPKINVDRSKQKDDAILVQLGLMSHEEYHGRYGEDADDYEVTVISEVKRRKDRIEQAGFENVREFVEVLSLDTKLFMSKITEDITPEDDALKQTPANKKKKVKQDETP